MSSLFYYYRDFEINIMCLPLLTYEFREVYVLLNASLASEPILCISKLLDR